MNVLKFLFFALLLSPVCLPAQSAEMRFGEVPVEDWKVEDCPWDTIPGALILGDQGHIRVYIESGKGYMQAFKRHVRIKILDEKAYDFANITIPYYSKEGKESVRDIKAHTLLPGNIKRPVNPKDIFTEKINDNWSARKFTFPALQPGAILEYEYLLESEYVFSLDKWEFQHELPVRWSRLNVDFEANLSYAYIVEFPAVKQLSNNNRGQITYANGASSSFQGNTFIMRRLPGLREEAYMTTLNDYRSRIRFQLSEIIRSDGSKQPYLSTWEKVASDLLNDEVFGKRYLKKSNTKKLLETGLPQMAAAASQKEKVDAACRFIKSKVQDRGRRGLFGSEKLDVLLERGAASSAERNLMLLALLTEAGIPAHPVLISTRDHGKTLQLYPMLDQFNYLIVRVEADGQTLFVDLGDDTLPLGYPSVQALNYKGWLLRDKEPAWIDLEPPVSAEGFTVKATIDAAGNLKGNFSAAFKGYEAADYRVQLAKNQDYWKQKMLTMYPEIRIQSVEVSALEALDETLKLSFDFELDGAAALAGDKAYFNPVLYTNFPENPFKAQERNYPIDIPYPFVENYQVELSFPANWTLDDFPDPSTMVLPKNGGRVRIISELKDNVFKLIFQTNVQQLQYIPEEYSNVKQFFDLLVSKQEEQLVFSIKPQ